MSARAQSLDRRDRGKECPPYVPGASYSNSLLARAVDELERLLKAGALQKMIQPCRKQRLKLPLKRGDLSRDAAQLIKLCRRIARAQRLVGDDCEPAAQQIAKARQRLADSVRWGGWIGHRG